MTAVVYLEFCSFLGLLRHLPFKNSIYELILLQQSELEQRIQHKEADRKKGIF